MADKSKAPFADDEEGLREIGTHKNLTSPDLGKELGVSGYLAGLTRTRVGEFTPLEAMPLTGFTEEKARLYKA